MTSGYTAAIADDITFEQYALSCARAFGALVMLRDEPIGSPIPEKFDVSDYHIKKLDELTERRKFVLCLTYADCERECDAEFKKQMMAYKETLERKQSLRKKYEAMLVQVLTYKAPSLDHVEYKLFMEKQIRDSIEWDCDTRHYHEPQKISCREWLLNEKSRVEKEITYHTEEHAKEVSRTEGRNIWIAQLRKSLEDTKRAIGHEA